MWFSLDSSSTWGPSIVSASPQSNSSALPSSSSGSSSLFSNLDQDNINIQASSSIDWQSNLKKSVAKPKQQKIPTDPLTKKTPAEEFVKISPNQRWNAQPIGFPIVQQQSYFVEKKTSIPVPTKSIEIQSVQAQSSQAQAQAQADQNEEEASQSLYKTELCRSFEETGSCRYGLKCQFAHGRSELRHVNRHPKYKTEVCKTFHTIGTCPYGKRCRFIHIEPIFNQNPPIKSSPAQPKPTEFVNVSQNNSGWSTSWIDPSPTPVNVSSVGNGAKPIIKAPLIETLPVMKTSNELNQPGRSRLVIFQQICS
jgi:hypothetical protein